jgi:hypothetical protein
MMQRTLIPLVLVGLGVGIGFFAKWLVTPPVACSSPSKCFDQIAVRQCKEMPKDNTAVRHRADNPDAPPLGVNDWLFVTYCEGGPQEIELTFEPPDPV